MSLPRPQDWENNHCGDGSCLSPVTTSKATRCSWRFEWATFFFLFFCEWFEWATCYCLIGSALHPISYIFRLCYICWSAQHPNQNIFTNFSMHNTCSCYCCKILFSLLSLHAGQKRAHGTGQGDAKIKTRRLNPCRWKIKISVEKVSSLTAVILLLFSS